MLLGEPAGDKDGKLSSKADGEAGGKPCSGEGSVSGAQTQGKVGAHWTSYTVCSQQTWHHAGKTEHWAQEPGTSWHLHR